MKQYTPKQIKLITSNFEYGQKFIQKGDFRQAENCYKDILKIDPEIDEANNALAYVYTISKQHQKAIIVLQSLLKANSKDANLQHNLANNFFALAQYPEAISHYQIAIKQNPQFVDSYVQCGMAYRKLGNYESAFQLFNQALSLDVRNAKNYHFISVANIDIKNYSLAVKNATIATEFAPDNREYHLSLANILKEAGNTYEADIQYHRTCSKFPDYLDAFLTYGKYLIDCKYFYEAIECFDQANKLAPFNLDILDSLGTCYLGIANAENALTFFNAALNQAPDRLSSLIGIAQAYQDTGKLDQAIQLCDRIISLDKDQPIGYILKSKVKKSTNDDGLCESLKNLLSNTKITEEDVVQINFALGKVYDDQKDYADAFKYYYTGNSIKKKQALYDKTATEDHFSEIIDFFTADFFKEYQHLGQTSNLPILIVGMPRSGTTLTEQIISSHPDVAGAGEVRFWSTTISSISSTLDTSLKYPQSISKIQKEYASLIVANYEVTLRKIVGNNIASHITDKMPHNFLCLGLIALLFSNIKIIHTQRDPIDTCLSIFFQNFNDNHPYANNLSDLGHYYLQYEKLMKHWKAVLPDRIMDIKYSDTVSDPEYWSRALISHIGLEWDDACLSPHKLERSVKTASHWQVRQPIYKTSVQRWKHYEQYLEPLISALKA